MRGFNVGLPRMSTLQAAYDYMVCRLHHAVAQYGAETTEERRGYINGCPSVQWFGYLYGEPRRIECQLLEDGTVDVLHNMDVHPWGSLLRHIFTH